MKTKLFTTMHDHNSFFKDIKLGWKRNRVVIIILAGSFLAAALILVFASQFEHIFPGYSVGDFKLLSPAPYDLIPNRNILWEDSEKTQRRRDEAEAAVLPVFLLDEDKTRVIIEKFATFQDFLTDERGGIYDVKKKLLYQNLGFTRVLSENVYKALLALPDSELEVITTQAKLFLSLAMNEGIISFTGIDRDLFQIKAIELARQTGGKTVVTEKALNEIITRQSISAWLVDRLSPVKISPLHKEYLAALVLAFTEENSYYSPALTLAARKRARRSMLPAQEILRKDVPVVSKGQIITREDYSKIQAFAKNAATDTANKIFGTLLFLALISLISIFLLGKRFAGRGCTRGQVILLVVMGLVYLIVGVLLVRILPAEGDYPLSLLMPTAAMAVIVTVIISPQAGIAFSFLLSGVAVIIHGDFNTFLFAFFSGIVSTAAVMRVTKRIDLVKAGFLLFFAHGILMAVISIVASFSLEKTLIVVASAAINGFFSLIMSIGFLPLFEHALNAPTPFRLIELSDINVPILKKMLVLAPGTYTHSINVANLSESASLAIGANALLARVGAYYHDIGKVDQPDYFIENQNADNVHDHLKPSLSAAVIKSHVKLGVEKAKELDLPHAVIDIIAQHHGKGLISYFFQRAKNDLGEGISREDYSYQGARPQTREAAIVMIADAVEAASRTLKKPTVAKIEKLVWQVIVERFHGAELLECALTLGDLEVIKKVFVQIIQGYLHQRIQYPATGKETM